MVTMEDGGTELGKRFVVDLVTGKHAGGINQGIR
jgi:hypothetical protein